MLDFTHTGAHSDLYWYVRFFCPSRQHRAAACLSLAGFQSGSKRMRRFAPMIFKPHPPALLDSRKMKCPPRRGAPELLNSSTICCRLRGCTPPSRRTNFQFCSRHILEKRSIVCHMRGDRERGETHEGRERWKQQWRGGIQSGCGQEMQVVW